jgi:eukaryotic-like serine/threonine-protein kinase
MGVVYAATNEKDELVALKLMSPEYARDGGYRRRFEREANAAMRLESPNAVRIFEAGIDKTDPIEHQPFMVMELLEGRTLEAALEADGPPAVRTAIRWILGALHAIAEAHSKGLVHRDIKTSNLFLTTASSIIKVLDFGIVKDIDPQLTMLTRTGEAIGTPAYMSPEQVRAAPNVDARADVWAVGVTLYELLTGSMPFERPAVADLLAAILNDDPAPLRSKRADVPDALDRIVTRCLSKDRDARFASASELRSALLELGFTEEIPAHDTHHPHDTQQDDKRVEYATTTPDFTPRKVAPPPRARTKKRPSETPRGLIFAGSLLGVLLLGGIGVVALARMDKAPLPPTTARATTTNGASASASASASALASASASASAEEPSLSVLPGTAASPSAPASSVRSASTFTVTSLDGGGFSAEGFGGVLVKRSVSVTYPSVTIATEQHAVVDWLRPIRSQMNACLKENFPCDAAEAIFTKQKTVTVTTLSKATRTSITTGTCDDQFRAWTCVQKVLEAHLAARGIFDWQCGISPHCTLHLNLNPTDDTSR